jgi:hypothetical protein
MARLARSSRGFGGREGAVAQERRRPVCVCVCAVVVVLVLKVLK